MFEILKSGETLPVSSLTGFANDMIWLGKIEVSKCEGLKSSATLSRLQTVRQIRLLAVLTSNDYAAWVWLVTRTRPARAEWLLSAVGLPRASIASL